MPEPNEIGREGARGREERKAGRTGWRVGGEREGPAVELKPTGALAHSQTHPPSHAFSPLPAPSPSPPPPPHPCIPHPPRSCFLVGMSLLLSWLNYRGLTVVGHAVVTSTVAIVLPFVLLCALALPRANVRGGGGAGVGGGCRYQAKLKRNPMQKGRGGARGPPGAGGGWRGAGGRERGFEGVGQRQEDAERERVEREDYAEKDKERVNVGSGLPSFNCPPLSHVLSSPPQNRTHTRLTPLPALRSFSLVLV